MTDTTDRQLDLQGVSLRTLRWDLESVEGLYGLPPRRGGTVAVPYRHGAYSYARKFYESRSLSVNERILPQNENGLVTLSSPWHHLYNNLDNFLALMYGTSDLSFTRTMANGSTQRELLVEVNDGFEVDVDRNSQHYLVDVPMISTNPFWRQLPEKNDVTSLNSASQTASVVVGGNAPVNDFRIQFDVLGDMTRIRVEGQTFGDFIEINIDLVISDTVVFDLLNRSFTLNGNRLDHAMSYNRPWFLEMQPGITNLYTVEKSGVGDANMTVYWYDKWL